MKGYDHGHPGTVILHFEPDHRDPAMLLANTFCHGQRYQLADLRSRRGALSVTLARHGLVLDEVALDDLQSRLAAQP